MIRCDAGPDIGMGHFMRSFALAQALSPNFRIVFVSRSLPKKYALWLKHQGYKFIRMSSKITLSSEVRCLQILVKKMKVSLLIVDTYAYRMKQLKALKKQTTLLDFDDSANPRNPADIIYSPYAMSGGRRIEKNHLSLFGVQYLVFSNDLKKIRRGGRSDQSKKKLKAILSMGGGDNLSLILRILKCFGPYLKNYNLVVNIGLFSKRGKRKLKKFCKQNNLNVSWLGRPSQLWSEMNSSDLALVSGGLTKYEAAYLGVPSMTFSRNSVEDLDCKHFEKLGFSVHAGGYSDLCSRRKEGEVPPIFWNHDLRRSMRMMCMRGLPKNPAALIRSKILKYLKSNRL